MVWHHGGKSPNRRLDRDEKKCAFPEAEQNLHAAGVEVLRAGIALWGPQVDQADD